jgi:hypothetical protein
LRRWGCALRASGDGSARAVDILRPQQSRSHPRSRSRHGRLAARHRDFRKRARTINEVRFERTGNVVEEA